MMISCMVSVPRFCFLLLLLKIIIRDHILCINMKMIKIHYYSFGHSLHSKHIIHKYKQASNLLMLLFKA